MIVIDKALYLIFATNIPGDYNKITLVLVFQFSNKITPKSLFYITNQIQNTKKCIFYVHEFSVSKKAEQKFHSTKFIPLVTTIMGVDIAFKSMSKCINFPLEHLGPGVNFLCNKLTCRKIKVLLKM